MNNTTSTHSVSESRIRHLGVFYYLVLILWPVYLLFLPPVLVNGGLLVVLYLIFPGLYLFTWLGYLMHESWHKFVPAVNNRFFYNAFALMLLSDPQLYFIIHGWHHSQVHTYQDSEFHPLGEIKSRRFRIVYNWLEVVFGTAFLIVVASFIIPRDKRFAKKYHYWKLPLSLVAIVIFMGGLAFLSHIIFNVRMSQAILAFALTYWLGSFFLHQSQLVEHGNLIINGTFYQRNIRTRNLMPGGIFEKIFLFFTHNDSREHVLHHTMPDVHSRPFPGEFSFPESAMFITMRIYLRILGRMLVGKVDEENFQLIDTNAK